MAGPLGARATDAQQVTQASCGNVVCRGDGCACRPGCVCCVYGNGNSRRPPGECGTGTAVACPPPTTTTSPPPPTTTLAPTTTTTTAAPTSTTTTTAWAPAQGYCPAGGDVYALGSFPCDFRGDRACQQTTSEETVCGGPPFCQSCTTDAVCAPCTGAGSFCVTAFGAFCSCPGGTSSTACVPPCPPPQ